jgi:hypothetical protein
MKPLSKIHMTQNATFFYFNYAPRHQQMGKSGGAAVHISLDIRSEIFVSFTRRSLYLRRKKPSSQCIVGCVGTTTRLKTSEKIILPFPGVEPKFLGHPFRNLVPEQAKLSTDKRKHKRNKDVKEQNTSRRMDVSSYSRTRWRKHSIAEMFLVVSRLF